MADKRKNRSLEWGKNLLIVLLALSALYLLGRTQLYTEGALSGGTWLSGVLSILPGQEEPEPTQPVGEWSQVSLIRPVRMVVIGPQGRTGIQYDNETVSSLFQDLANPLSDALAGASAPEVSSEAKFRAALTSKNPGVYLDFLGEVPLPNLSASLSGGRASGGVLTDSIRRLLLTVTTEGEVLLYYINEETGMYYASQTSPDLADRLEQFAAKNAPNGAAFAFESGETYASLRPYTLLEGGAAPRPGKYAVTDPVPLDPTSPEHQGEAFNALVRSLSFHPQSMSYPNRDGISIQEGTEKLRIFPGMVEYKAVDLENPRYPIQSSGSALKRWEIVGSAWGLVDKVLTPLCGEARIYVSGVEAMADGGAAVYFSYQLDGAPVPVGQEGYAARMEINGSAITAFTLRLRCYSYLEQGPSVLPELQATAALEAKGIQDAELMLYYGDSLGDTVTAAWGAF